jgi:hypothetical protein
MKTLSDISPRSRAARSHSAEPISPTAVVDRLEVAGGTIHVVRDDVLAGGTKQRAMIPWLLDLRSAGVRELVYASPFCGFAQVALAASCRAIGLGCRVFAERDGSREGYAPHELTALAASYGASTEIVPTLAHAERAAVAHARAGEHRRKLPLGFDDEGFRRHLRRALEEQWQTLERRGVAPRRVWLPVGSGTLATVFRSLLAPEVELACVDVRVLPADDVRLTRLATVASVRWYSAPELFHERAASPPPIPSNRWYDAKLWRLLDHHARAGDLWWNVAR